MTAPLLLLALVWDRWRIGERRWLRGRVLRVGRLRAHSTSVISGLLFVMLGALFLAFDGTAGLDGGLGLSDVEGAAQEWVAGTLGAVPDALVLLAVSVVAVTVLTVRWHRRPGRPDRPPRTDSADTVSGGSA